MKNKVTESAFLNWYFSDSDDVKWLGERAMESLLREGKFKISVEMLFDDCGFIPQYICEDSEGNADYDPSEVELIKG